MTRRSKTVSLAGCLGDAGLPSFEAEGGTSVCIPLLPGHPMDPTRPHARNKNNLQ